MAFSLPPQVAEQGYRLESHDVVGSTNAMALDRARAGDPGQLWIAARSQESGRGRRGRAWATPQGNLAATLLTLAGPDLRQAATLGFVAGLALADALDAVTPRGSVRIGVDGGGTGFDRFELKWPNDVLAGGAKLAGILLESEPLAGGGYALAIGIGVNVVAYPESLPYRATSLRALGSDCDAETLFRALAEAWARNAYLWDEGRGLSAVRNRWLTRAAGLGGEVAVRVDGNVVRGVFETIDEDCRFVIRGRKGQTVVVTAGDVHFGAVASAMAG